MLQDGPRLSWVGSPWWSSRAKSTWPTLLRVRTASVSACRAASVKGRRGSAGCTRGWRSSSRPSRPSHGGSRARCTGSCCAPMPRSCRGPVKQVDIPECALDSALDECSHTASPRSPRHVACVAQELRSVQTDQEWASMAVVGACRPDELVVHRGPHCHGPRRCDSAAHPVNPKEAGRNGATGSISRRAIRSASGSHCATTLRSGVTAVPPRRRPLHRRPTAGQLAAGCRRPWTRVGDWGRGAVTYAATSKTAARGAMGGIPGLISAWRLALWRHIRQRGSRGSVGAPPGLQALVGSWFLANAGGPHRAQGDDRQAGTECQVSRPRHLRLGGLGNPRADHGVRDAPA